MAAPPNEVVLERLKQVFRTAIPSGGDIARRAVTGALRPSNGDVEWIKANFSKLVESVQLDAYQEYLAAERSAGAKAIAEVMLPLVGANATAEQAIEVMGQYFSALDRFFLGVGQGRKPRAGKAFELLIRELFGRLGYPFASQPIINGQPDFVLPSLEHFIRHAPDCIIFTVKRTLRERWRQIVTEGTRGLGFFLATIDEDVSARDLPEMLRSRITLVVPERLKHMRSDYEQAPNVVSFEYFFQFHLDPSMARWKQSGALGR